MTVFVWKTAEQAKNYRQNKPIEAVSEIITIWEKPQEPMLTIPILAAQVESDEPELNKAQLDEIDLDSAQSVQLQSEEESEYANLAIADVSNYVNVRSEPSTEGEIVGKIYNGAVAQILGIAGEEEDWLRIISGSVEGYIKAEYFIYGEAAAEVVETITQLGGKARSSVSAKTDYLVVGNAGNPCWAYACYGRKIEEAVNLRKEGASVVIVNETDFWDAVDDATAGVTD